MQTNGTLFHFLYEAPVGISTEPANRKWIRVSNRDISICAQIKPRLRANHSHPENYFVAIVFCLYFGMQISSRPFRLWRRRKTKKTTTFFDDALGFLLSNFLVSRQVIIKETRVKCSHCLRSFSFNLKYPINCCALFICISTDCEDALVLQLRLYLLSYWAAIICILQSKFDTWYSMGTMNAST